MGTLLGHVLPGVFFLIFAVWRLIQTVRRQQLLRQFRRDGDVIEAYYTSATYTCYAGCFASWPVEGIAKVVLTAVGMAGELWASTDYGLAGGIASMGDIQHITMYCMFFVSGVADVIVWSCTSRSDDVDPVFGQYSAPPGVDFVALAAAFFVEALLFSQHIHGRTDFDKLLHYLLVYVMIGTALSVLIECMYRRSLNGSLATTFFLFVQGTWFIQVGLLLYPPSNSIHRNLQSWLYSLSDEDQTILVTIIFSWHLAAGFLLLAVFYVILHKLFSVICCECANSREPYDVYTQTGDVEYFFNIGSHRVT